MPHRILQDSQLDYIRQHAGRPCSDLAAELGVHVDTLKRYMMRHGIREFPGAKYQHLDPVPTWRRPCMRCGCTRPRPRGQYRCDPCVEATADFDEAFA